MKPNALNTRRQALLFLAGLALAGSPVLARAQSDKPVRFILPVSAGSGVDAITRAASNQLGKALGQSVVVDNQPGAGGVVGTQNLVKAAPDGQTLGMVSNNHVIYPSVLKSLPFDPVADVTPIAVVGSTPMVLVVNPKVPANNLKELVALLKTHPGKYNYGSAGNGTILHLGAEQFKDATGTFSTHIPYREAGAGVPRCYDRRGSRRAGLPGRGLVCGHRPQGPERGAGEAREPGRRDRVQHARGQGGDGQTGQHDPGLHPGGCDGPFQARTGQVRGAGEEGGRRAAVGLGDPAVRRGCSLVVACARPLARAWQRVVQGA